jgi:uncharacterized protein YegL
MLPIQEDMNGGIRTWLNDIVAADPTALITSVLFDDKFDETNVRTAVSDVKPSSLQITARGGTALNDAIMRGLGSIKKGEKSLVFIVTDGEENSSKEATIAQVKKAIARLEKSGTEFQYLSASPSAFNDAEAYGIASASTTHYAANTVGTRMVSQVMAQSTTSYLNKEDNTWQQAATEQPKKSKAVTP